MSKEHQNLVSQLCIPGPFKSYDCDRESSPSNLPIDPEDYPSDDDLDVRAAREELMKQGSPLSQMYGSIFEMRYGECEGSIDDVGSIAVSIEKVFVSVIVEIPLADTFARMVTLQTPHINP
jgi:hypothetical protein